VSEPFAERANRIPWPPIVYGIVLMAALALDRIAPLAWLAHGWGWRALGSALAVAGIAVAAAGFIRFRAFGTPVDPTARVEVLVTTGIYAYTRNPMYLGITVALLGLGLALRSEWLLILALLMPLALQRLAIVPEERHLDARFGEAWRAYAARVRRWL
jgi:protein-S-isoprenylcysteine O-methyltransferase Ste14